MDFELQKQVSKVTQKKKLEKKGLIGFLTNLDPNKMSLKFIFLETIDKFSGLYKRLV